MFFILKKKKKNRESTDHYIKKHRRSLDNYLFGIIKIYEIMEVVENGWLAVVEEEWE